MIDPQYPQDDAVLQTPEFREMLRALDLAGRLESASTGSLSAEEVRRLWLAVKRRADVALAPAHPGFLDRLRETVAQGWRDVAAALVQESLLPSPAVRGGALPRLLVYETEDLAISLTFLGQAEAARFRLVGQMAPKVAQQIPAGGQVELWCGSETFVAAVNEHGEFAVDDVPRGDLHLDILLGDERIQLSPVHTQGMQAAGG